MQVFFFISAFSCLFSLYMAAGIPRSPPPPPPPVVHPTQPDTKHAKTKHDSSYLTVTDADGLLACNEETCYNIQSYWVRDMERLQCMEQYLPIGWDSPKANDPGSIKTYLSPLGTVKETQAISDNCPRIKL